MPGIDEELRNEAAGQKGAPSSDTIPLALALGSLLALGGLAALTIGIYALTRESRSRHGV